MSQALDVKLIGAVSLRVKCLEVVLREEEAYEVEIQYMDFVTDFAPLFVTAHSGHVSITRELLVSCPLRLISSSCFLPSSYQSLLYYFGETIKQTYLVDIALYI